MLGFIIVILFVCGFSYIFGFRIAGLVKEKEEDKNKPKPMKDYIIFFKDEENNKVLTHQILKEIGSWKNYGNGYRGLCDMEKEEIESFIKEKTLLQDGEFDVFPVYNGLNWILK